MTARVSLIAWWKARKLLPDDPWQLHNEMLLSADADAFKSGAVLV